MGGTVSDVERAAVDDAATGGLADAQMAGGDLLRIGRERGGEDVGAPASLLASPEAYAVR